MSISQNFPEEGPTLNLNFAGSRTLDPRITFTRTSGATYMGRDGLIKVSPTNSARFDHRYNPTTGEVESLGLLVEEQRANLVVRSEEFQTTWIQFRATVNSNASVAPNGQIAADTIVEDSTPDSHGVLQTINGLINSTTYSASCYFKASGRDRCRLLLFGTAYPSGTAYADFNLTSVTSTPQAGVTASITNVGRGWYRCSITATTSATGVADLYIQPLDASGAAVYLGNGAAAIDIWGAQLEQGSFPTSYIPTTNTTATRTADNASITGSNFSSWYNSNESTFFTSFRPAYNASATVPARTPHVLQAGNATTVNDNYTIRGAESNLYWTVLIRSASPSSLQFPGFNPYPYLNSSTQYKAALSVNSSLISVSLNGLLNADSANTTTVNHTTPFNKLFIGSGTGGGPPYELSGHIAQITYYPQRLQNSQLVTLTR